MEAGGVGIQHLCVCPETEAVWAPRGSSMAPPHGLLSGMLRGSLGLLGQAGLCGEAPLALHRANSALELPAEPTLCPSERWLWAVIWKFEAFIPSALNRGATKRCSSRAYKIILISFKTTRNK